LTDWPNSVCSPLLSDLLLISSEYSKDPNPILICKDEDVQTALDEIIKIPRLQKEGTLIINEEKKINVIEGFWLNRNYFKVEFIPGLPKLPVYSFDGKMIKYLDSSPEKNFTIKLIGFTNSQNLFNVKSSPLAHCIKPIGIGNFLWKMFLNFLFYR
jgi:hypothetical protein